MAESMSGQIVSIACALSKADEGEKALLEMICKAQEERLARTLKEGVTRQHFCRRRRSRMQERAGRRYPPCARET